MSLKYGPSLYKADTFAYFTYDTPKKGIYPPDNYSDSYPQQKKDSGQSCHAVPCKEQKPILSRSQLN